jgi:phage-related baseplate assembly protein
MSTSISRFSAVALDASRLPPPDAIRGVSFETIADARVASLKARFNAAGIAYDLGTLELNPAVILQQEDAYREMLDLAAINDAVRAVLPMFARGADLDQIAARYGVTRMPGETDDRFRRRVLAAPEAFSSAGAVGGYIFHATTADLAVKDVSVWSPSPGTVHVAVMSIDGDGSAPAALVESVRARLVREDIKPLTDVLSVFSVTVTPYGFTARLRHASGPDPAVLKANAEADLSAYAAERHKAGRTVPLSGLIDAAYQPACEGVVIEGLSADIDPGVGGTAFCTGFTVLTELVDA